MGTRTVTGTIYQPDGSAWAGGEVVFKLLDAFETASEVYPVEEITKTLDANGQFSITLGVPDSGTAHYSVTLPDGVIYRFYLAAGTAVNLVTLITIATTAVSQSALQTLIDANNILTIRSLSTAGTIAASDDVLECNGTFTVTLPAATGAKKPYAVKNIGTGVITLDGAGSETIDGSANLTISTLSCATVYDSASGIWFTL